MKCLGATLFFSFVVASSHAAELDILSWDTNRGGLSALPISSNYQSARNAIMAAFPYATITGTAEISESALIGKEVVWLDAGRGETDAITPLSQSEKNALMSFVLNGGKAILFTDNDTFASDAPAANLSLISQFGATCTGTYSGFANHTFLNISAFPLTGRFGTVANLTSGFPGWFNSLPSSAFVVSTFGTGGSPFIAGIPAGAIGANSGPIWLLSNGGAVSTGGSIGANWNLLYTNILDPGNKISGSIVVEDTAPTSGPETINWTLTNGTNTASGTLVHSGYGLNNLDITIPPSLPRGVYTLRMKGGTFLAKSHTLTIQYADGSAGTFYLPNGDVDQDGEIGTSDFDLVVEQFGNSGTADVDNDGEVGTSDFDIVVQNFGLQDN